MHSGKKFKSCHIATISWNWEKRSLPIVDKSNNSDIIYALRCIYNYLAPNAYNWTVSPYTSKLWSASQTLPSVCRVGGHQPHQGILPAEPTQSPASWHATMHQNAPHSSPGNTAPLAVPRYTNGEEIQRTAEHSWYTDMIPCAHFAALAAHLIQPPGRQCISIW